MSPSSVHFPGCFVVVAVAAAVVVVEQVKLAALQETRTPIWLLHQQHQGGSDLRLASAAAEDRAQ